MLLDSHNEFCDAVALNTGGAGIYNLGSTIDLVGLGANTVVGETTNEFPGNSEDIYLVIQVDTLPTSGTSAATAQFKLVSDSTAVPSADATPTQHFATKAFAISEMAAGAQLVKVELPIGTYERYLGIQQVTAGEAFTGGKINAFLTNRPNNWHAAKDAIN